MENNSETPSSTTKRTRKEISLPIEYFTARSLLVSSSSSSPIPVVDFGTRVVECKSRVSDFPRDAYKCKTKSEVRDMISIHENDYRKKICYKCFDHEQSRTSSVKRECQSCERFCEKNACFEYEGEIYCERCLFDDRVIRAAFHRDYDYDHVEDWRSRHFLLSEATPEYLALCDKVGGYPCNGMCVARCHRSDDPSRVIRTCSILHHLKKNGEAATFSTLPQIWKDRINVILETNKAYYAGEKKRRLTTMAGLIKKTFPSLSDVKIIEYSRMLIHYPGMDIFLTTPVEIVDISFLECFVHAYRYMYCQKKEWEFHSALRRNCPEIYRGNTERIYKHMRTHSLVPPKRYKDLTPEEFVEALIENYTPSTPMISYQTPYNLSFK